MRYPELEKLGPYKALTGTWLMMLQHGVSSRSLNEIEAELYIKQAIGIGMVGSEKTRAIIDLIEDASDAMREVQFNGLHVHRLSMPLGEPYLRLYGALNASFLMTGALGQLAELFMPEQKGTFLTQLRNQPLHILRNRLAAHPLDFSPTKAIYHRLVQMDMMRLDGKRSYTASDIGYQEVDIIEQMKQFEKTSLGVFLETTEHKVLDVIRSDSEHRSWVKERLDFVRSFLS